MNSLHDYIPLRKTNVFESRALTRDVESVFLLSSQGRWVAGVCKGIENSFGVSVWITRPLFALTAVYGVGALIYLVIAVVSKSYKDLL